MAVKPVGEAVFEADGRTYCIGAAELKQGELAESSSAAYKDGTGEWSVFFSEEHETGTFIWQVYLSMGTSGASLDGFGLIKHPANVTITGHMGFVLVDG